MSSDAVAIAAPRAVPKPPTAAAVKRREPRAVERSGADESSLSEKDASLTDDSGSELSQALTELSLAGSQTRYISSSSQQWP